MAAIERIQAAFTRLPDAKVYVYPGARHGFMTMTPGRGYMESAAHFAWARSLEVFKKLLIYSLRRRLHSRRFDISLVYLHSRKALSRFPLRA